MTTGDDLLIGPAIEAAVEKARPRLVRWLANVMDSVETEDDLQVTLTMVRTAGGEREIASYVHELDQLPEETIAELLLAAVEDLDLAAAAAGTVFYTVQIGGKPGRVNFNLPAHPSELAREADLSPTVEATTADRPFQIVVPMSAVECVMLEDVARRAGTTTTDALRELLRREHARSSARTEPAHPRARPSRRSKI